MIHITGDLSLVERKLSNVLLLNAYNDLLTQEEFSIPVNVLVKLLGWGDESKNIDHLRKALNTLQTTLIKFDRLTKRGTTAWLDIQLVGRGKIENGICTYTYDSELRKRMANPETAFGMIDIDIQNRFASSYALALYENCVRFKRVGSTGFQNIELWRELLGAESKAFDEFKRFSEKVMNPSIKQVNKVSDIEITAEYQKTNRKTTAIRYSIKDKAQKSMDFSEPFEQEEARQTELFKRLVGHGIAEALALDWIANKPERALQAIDHVEFLEKLKPIKNPAGYIRTIVESNSAIKISPNQAKKAEKEAANAAEKAKADTENLDRTKAIDAIIKGLSADVVREYAATYVAGDGAGASMSYSAETGKFKSSLERVQFTTWLRAQVSPPLA